MKIIPIFKFSQECSGSNPHIGTNNIATENMLNINSKILKQ